MARPISGKTVTFSQLTGEVAASTDRPRPETKTFIEEVFEQIRLALHAGDNVSTPIGSFKRKDQVAVAGGEEKPNPFKPGEMYITKDRPALAGVKFSPNKTLKDFLNG